MTILTIDGIDYAYEGEMAYGVACGQGVATCDYAEVNITGTFLNGLREGVCKSALCRFK